MPTATQARSQLVARSMVPSPRSQALRPGTTLGPFTLTSVLGHGGTAMVFAAHDAERGRDVALKVLTSDADPVLGDRARKRLLAEART
ncbi:MAG: hypothetical protein K0V04_45145, partial [Deltaproteobacteria bacterium]|nr:hypothetical protein [Deltaproteobacteria bacterium]